MQSTIYSLPLLHGRASMDMVFLFLLSQWELPQNFLEKSFAKVNSDEFGLRFVFEGAAGPCFSVGLREMLD